jgi:hypothetical protein
MNNLVTMDEVKAAVPTTLKTAITQQLVDKINAITDPELADNIRQNFIGYVHVLKDGKFKIEEYLNAVTYVSFKLMGMSNQDAYEKTFPDRMGKHILSGSSKKDVSSYVAAYAKGKLVNLIYEQSIIPTWVLNQDAFQEAINTQVDIMRTSTSDIARTQAANSVMTHLKKPDVKEFQISMETKEHSGMKELAASMRDLAKAQNEAIEKGIPTAQIAAQPITDGEFTEVDVD